PVAAASTPKAQAEYILSALPAIADGKQTSQDFRKVPKAVVSRCSNASVQKGPDLLDHLVGADQYRVRNLASDRLCRLEVDHELKLRWLLDRYVPRMFATQQPGKWRSHLRIDFLETRAIGGEATLFRAFGKLIDRRHPQFRGAFKDHPSMGVEDHGCQHIERFRARRVGGVDSWPDLLHLRCAVGGYLDPP